MAAISLQYVYFETKKLKNLAVEFLSTIIKSIGEPIHTRRRFAAVKNSAVYYELLLFTRLYFIFHKDMTAIKV